MLDRFVPYETLLRMLSIEGTFLLRLDARFFARSVVETDVGDDVVS
jgi:hypothetical protein